MASRFLASTTFALSFTVLSGCGQKPTQTQSSRPAVPADTPVATITFPDLGAARPIQPGIRFQEANLRPGGMPMRVWYYQPEKAADKLALVLVPPAGSTLFVGMALAEGDRSEHYPYVRAGFAVASFDIQGHVANMENAPDMAVLKGAQEFRQARAGLDNVKATLDFLQAKVPSVDPNRIFIAGHSSAATLALLGAEHEPRIKACAAFAPVTDVEDRLDPIIAQLDATLPGYRDFLHFSSPKTHADKLKCPVFLFHAKDDRNVPIRQSADFATLLKKTNSHVKLVTVPSGGHYESMIRAGIPKAIEWFQHVPKEAR